MASEHERLIYINFRQILCIESIEHNLKSLFQKCMNDIIVNNNPLTALAKTHNLERVSLSAHSILWFCVVLCCVVLLCVVMCCYVLLCVDMC
jgi:hypothetical protein